MYGVLCFNIWTFCQVAGIIFTVNKLSQSSHTYFKVSNVNKLSQSSNTYFKVSNVNKLSQSSNTYFKVSNVNKLSQSSNTYFKVSNANVKDYGRLSEPFLCLCRVIVKRAKQFKPHTTVPFNKTHLPKISVE